MVILLGISELAEDLRGKAPRVGTLIMGIGYGPVTPASSHLLVRTKPYSMMSIVFSIKQPGVPRGGAMAGAVAPHLGIFCGWKMSAL